MANTYLNVNLDSTTGGGGSGTSVADGKYVITNRFETISSGTSGTATLPANSTVVLDNFGGTVDAVVTQMSGGHPTNASAVDASGVPISATFDASGNWSFSGTPSSYSVALIYSVKQTLEDFDDTATNIVGTPVINSGAQWGQITGTLSQQSDLQTNLNLKALKVDIQEFSASGTWTKPSGSPLWVEVHVLAGGGGGGSGARVASGTACSGGAGGAGGGCTRKVFQASTLGSTETVTVGSGGTGGAAQTVDSTAGIAGGAGGQSTFGIWAKATGGGAGGGGAIAGASTGGTAGFGGYGTTTVGAAGTSGAAGVNSTGNSLGNGGQNGAGGGGISTTPAAFVGGNALTPNYVNTTTKSGGANTGGAGASGLSNLGPNAGQAGAGGGASITGAGGAGGNAGPYAAAGGGGGSSLNSSASGKGGDGSSGLIIVTTYF